MLPLFGCIYVGRYKKYINIQRGDRERTHGVAQVSPYMDTKAGSRGKGSFTCSK